MNRRIRLGYSPCPNDTFIFHAMAHGLIDTGGIDVDIRLADVEALNQAARSGALEMTKLSFAALGHLLDTYAPLPCGGALGRGCGPLIVARPETSLSDLGRSAVAVPGLWTTARLLLGLFRPDIAAVAPMRFDRIMPAVAGGRYPAGVIIHEGRFTYADHGLVKLLDLGQWWESETGLPIPLGGIAVRRDLGSETARLLADIVRRSVIHAMRHPAASDGYIRRHAQEMAPDVIQRHIDLYVNDFSVDLGAEGKRAIETLFERARREGLMPASDQPLFP